MIKISRKLSTTFSIILIVLITTDIGMFITCLYTDMDFWYVQIFNYFLLAISIIRILFLREKR